MPPHAISIVPKSSPPFVISLTLFYSTLSMVLDDIINVTVFLA